MERINTLSPLPLAYQSRSQILHLKYQRLKHKLKCRFDCLILKGTFLQQQNNVAYSIYIIQSTFVNHIIFFLNLDCVCHIAFLINTSFRFFLTESKLHQSKKKAFFNLDFSNLSKIFSFSSNTKCLQFSMQYKLFICKPVLMLSHVPRYCPLLRRL